MSESKKIKLDDAIVDDIALYLGREYLIPGRPGVATYPPRAGTMDAWRIITAVLSHPDAAGLFADEDDRPWEPLNGRTPRVGDEVRQDYCGVTATAVAARVDDDGSPWTAEGRFIGRARVGTWYFRRAIQDLPTEDGAVIVPADGREFIEAKVNRQTFITREAVVGQSEFGPVNVLHGAWRMVDDGARVQGQMGRDFITPGTWKVESE